MKLAIDEDGSVKLPEVLLECWGVSAGRHVEVSVEKGRLVLKFLVIEGDPFVAGARGPGSWSSTPRFTTRRPGRSSS